MLHPSPRTHAGDAEVLSLRLVARDAAGGGRGPGGRRLDADRPGEHRRVLRFPARRRAAEQQAVSITATDGGPIGEYRYLLWDVRPTRSYEWDGYDANTFYGEFDVYKEEGD